MIESPVRAMLLAAALGGAGCDQATPTHPADNPGVQDMAAAAAMLSGHVLDETGAPVMGATVQVVETKVMATTAADGSFTVAVPGDTTFVLHGSLAGRADTRVQALSVPAGTASSGLDVYLLPQAQVDAANQMGGGTPTTRAVVAVIVSSLSGKYTEDGATVALEPAYAGTALYAGAGPGVVAPDAQQPSIAPGALVGAWLVSVTPPSTYYAISVEKSGCAQVPFPVTSAGRVYTGGFQVKEGGLTQFNVFVE